MKMNAKRSSLCLEVPKYKIFKQNEISLNSNSFSLSSLPLTQSLWFPGPREHASFKSWCWSTPGNQTSNVLLSGTGFVSSLLLAERNSLNFLTCRNPCKLSEVTYSMHPLLTAATVLPFSVSLGKLHWSSCICKCSAIWKTLSVIWKKILDI